ncbi:hypothetical protein ACFV2N_18865 [Streptomyces sp. NPDC059680]|uniref:hypothetical protein n=1 Tax=Streptomyces sp. NPDC059680 TaxID=3346904 RepID=UPI0036929A4D
MDSAVWAAIIGALGGTAVGAFISGFVALSRSQLQRTKEYLVVRKATYSACATALMTHYTALQSLKSDCHTLRQDTTLAAERFQRLSALNTVAMQSVAAVMVEGPSQTASAAEEAARALEWSSKNLRRWIVSSKSEPPPSDLDSSYDYVEVFMMTARRSLRHPPHDPEMDEAPAEPAK